MYHQPWMTCMLKLACDTTREVGVWWMVVGSGGTWWWTESSTLDDVYAEIGNDTTRRSG